MSKGKRIGAILILIGICIPLISFVFVEAYDSRLGFWQSVTATRGIHIKLWKRQNESNLLEKYKLPTQWEDVVSHPRFQQKDFPGKIEVAKKYYQKFILPLHPEFSEEQFIESVKPSIYGNIVLPYKYSFALGII